MDKELSRNGSGYYDPTAYIAMNKYQKEERNAAMEILRGDLFSYEMNNEDRVALVVSADFRKTDRYVNVILLTEEPKGIISHSVTTNSGVMYADCGMVSFAQNTRLGDYLKTISEKEMQAIDGGIMQCLGLDYLQKEVVVEKPIEVVKGGAKGCEAELAQAKAEANVYKGLYEKLLEKVMG